jgi:hypothetical protein
MITSEVYPGWMGNKFPQINGNPGCSTKGIYNL